MPKTNDTQVHIYVDPDGSKSTTPSSIEAQSGYEKSKTAGSDTGTGTKAPDQTTA